MVIMAAMMFMVVSVTVSTAFRLEGGLDLSKISPQATEHVFYYMVGLDKKNVVSNFGRQMPISQVPYYYRRISWVEAFLPHQASLLS